MMGAAKFGRLLDAGMVVTLVLLMGSPVTGRAAHEWLGLALAGLALAHQRLNRGWYARLTRGRYTARRAGMSLLTALLLAALGLTAASGILMSAHAVPFLAADTGLDGIRRLETFFYDTLGLASTLSELGIRPEDYPLMAQKACAGGELRGFRTLRPADVEEILRMCG